MENLQRKLRYINDRTNKRILSIALDLIIFYQVVRRPFNLFQAHWVGKPLFITNQLHRHIISALLILTVFCSIYNLRANNTQAFVMMSAALGFGFSIYVISLSIKRIFVFAKSI